MTKEDKDLLVIDLSERLPYGVKYVRDAWNYECDQEMSVVEVLEDIDKEGYINYHKIYGVWDIKPYLLPISSMTDEEHKEWRALDKVLKTALEINRLRNDGVEIDEAKAISMVLQAEVERDQLQIDWLNSHHFDYRGLIEKGLALEAPKDMYDLNNESR